MSTPLSPQTLRLLVFSLIGFLSGSVMYSQLLPKIFLHRDIMQESEDGNPGAHNVFQLCGIGMGLACVTLDILKGYLPLLLASRLTDTSRLLFALVMASPAAGHALGLFNHFKGGKCIAVIFGCLFALFPPHVSFLVLAVLYILSSTLLRIPSHRRRSITVFVLFAVIAGFLEFHSGHYSIMFGDFAMSAIAIYRHLRIPETEEDKQLEESRQAHYSAKS